LIRSFVGETLGGKLPRVRGFESYLINKCVAYLRNIGTVITVIKNLT
jgi:hypothetical protein